MYLYQPRNLNLSGCTDRSLPIINSEESNNMQSSQLGFNPNYAEDAPTLEQVSGLIGDALLEFGVPWCGHCQAARPAVEEVLNEHLKLPHIKLYDGKGKPLGRAFRVKLWPTLILLHDGKEVARLVRPLNTDEVRQLLAQCA
ncbi:MAG: thioredoxin 1 [Psychromonas sp.]